MDHNVIRIILGANECPCKQTLNAKHFIFNEKHVMLSSITYNNFLAIEEHLRKLQSGHTGRRPNTQTKVISTSQLCCKVLKRKKKDYH